MAASFWGKGGEREGTAGWGRRGGREARAEEVVVWGGIGSEGDEERCSPVLPNEGVFISSV